MAGRWYVRYRLSYAEVSEWLAERAKTIAAIWEPIALVYREDEQDGGTR